MDKKGAMVCYTFINEFLKFSRCLIVLHCSNNSILKFSQILEVVNLTVGRKEWIMGPCLLKGGGGELIYADTECIYIHGGANTGASYTNSTVSKLQ